MKSSSITRASVIHYVHAHAYIAWYPAQRDEANVWEHNSVAQGAANQLAIPIQCGLQINSPLPTSTPRTVSWRLRLKLVTDELLRFLVSSFLSSHFLQIRHKNAGVLRSVVGWDLNTPSPNTTCGLSWAMESAARDDSPDPSWLEACRAVGDDPDAILAQNIAAYDILGGQGERDRKRGTIV